MGEDWRIHELDRKELLTADETATKLNVTRRTILKWARENRIESVRISRKVVLFSADAIDEFLRSNTNRVESGAAESGGAGRKTSPTKRKGGGKRSKGELWNDLRKEVKQWQ